MKPILLALLLSMFCIAAAAQERILSYDSEVKVAANGELDITERIVVRAEGNKIRRGIYRDFPTRYHDHRGNRTTVDFEVLEVTRDGKPERWFTEQIHDGVRINTGDNRLLPTPAEYTYTLHYRTSQQLGFFPKHDELYWNAIGTNWDFPIESGNAKVELPQPVPASEMQLQAYTGHYGEREQRYRSEVIAPGIVQWTLTQPLAAHQGLTVVVGFPKGIVTGPTWLQRVWSSVPGLLTWAGFVALLAFCIARWRKAGHDKKRGTVVVRYDPPAGYSPGELRFMQRMDYDDRCFSADLLALAVAGALRIRRERHGHYEEWSLERTGTGDPGPGLGQAMLLDHLFPEGADVFNLEDSGGRIVSAQLARAESLRKHALPAMFTRNRRSIAIAVSITLATVTFALFALRASPSFSALLILLLAPLVTVAFVYLIKMPTPKGRALLDEIEGFKRYLAVAERDELKRLTGPHPAPPLDEKRYEALLPFAVALNVEEAWTKQLTDTVGAAVAAQTASQIDWYDGSAISDLDSFRWMVGDGLTSRITASSGLQDGVLGADGDGNGDGFSGGSGFSSGGGFSGGGAGGGGGGGR